MKDFWSQRFAAQEYAYGEQPNVFFRQQLDLLPVGKLLLPAEGEGRNAVYAACKGWEVWAYDFSEAAREKAMSLAQKCGELHFRYDLCTHQEASYPEEYFDVVALIFAHTPERKLLHERAVHWLRPGGMLLLEGFSKKQLHYTSGGPKQEALLFDRAMLKSDFQSLSTFEIEEAVVVLDEGPYHQGQAAVIRVVGRK